MAVGAEYRTEYLNYETDYAYQQQWGAGQGGPQLPVSGDYNVKEFFVEGLVPLVQDARGAKDLSLELGYRYSDYSNTGGWPTYKIQGSWAPMSPLKFRLGYNRATRSPNIVELYTPQSLGLNGTQDICAGPNPSYTREQCARTGVTAAQYGNVLPNPADQYNSFDGGNPDLEPETANTYTVGIVVAPSGTGFTTTLDYFNIRIDNTIGTLLPDDVVQQCAETGNPTLCNLVHRDVAGTLWLFTTGYTIDTNQNVGKRWSEGIDLTVGYVKSLGDKGSFTANLIASYIFSQRINTGLYEYDCATYFGNQCGVPVPTWRHLARFAWQAPFKTTFSLTWRLIGPVTNDDGSPNPAIGDPGNVETLKINDIYEIPTYNYWDISAAYQLTKNYQIVGGLNNLFDKEPPLSPGMSPNDYGTGWYGTYDPLGRYFFMGVQVTF
jgi:outer membrane receptor protein involved in Fe transport